MAAMDSSGQKRRGEEGPGEAVEYRTRWGVPGNGKAGPGAAAEDRRGLESMAWDRNGSSESEWKGMAFHGVAWIGSRGPEGLGVDGTREDGRVMAGIGEAVMDRKGTACIGIDWTGKAATDGLGVASRVMALNGSSGTGSNG